MEWKEKMAAIISVFGTILVVESVGLGQYLASALTMDTPQKRYIWGIVGAGVLVFLMIVNYTLLVKRSKRERGKEVCLMSRGGLAIILLHLVGIGFFLWIAVDAWFEMHGIP